jgi:hypothetical protein
MQHFSSLPSGKCRAAFKDPFHSPDDCGGADLQYFSQFDERSDGRTLYASLNQADVRTIEITVQSELFLRNFPSLADLAESLSEGLFGPKNRLDVPAP